MEVALVYIWGIPVSFLILQGIALNSDGEKSKEYLFGSLIMAIIWPFILLVLLFSMVRNERGGRW